MKFSLDQIKTLVAINEEGSFAAAAARLNKAQSAVSYDIRQMEQRLGVKIFDRKGYRASLTDVGAALLREGQFLLMRAQEIETLADRFRDGWEPSLELIIDGILPMEPIMNLMKTLSEEGVPTRIQLKVEFLAGVQHRFEQERADMMLVKEFTPRNHLTAMPLPEVQCFLVAAREHPLVKSGEKVSRRELIQHVELAINDSSESSLQVNRHMFGGSRAFYLSDFYTKRQALLKGLGFGWMPLYLIKDDLAKGDLQQIPYEHEAEFSFTPHLVHPKTRPLGKTGQRILELITAG